MTYSGNHIPTWLFLLAVFMNGCVPHIAWVTESLEPSSCNPDAPPIWKDYTPKDWESIHSAQTAVQFVILSRNPPRLEARFDQSKSLVKPHIISSWYPYDQELRQRLLRHEQLHFAISCLLTRQANVTLQSNSDLDQMLLLLRATAQRLNLQYDKETKHGTIPARQAQWEEDVVQQLEAVSSGKQLTTD